MRKLLLIAFGIVLALGAMEVALRINPPENIKLRRSNLSGGKWVEHPFLPYAGVPNQTFVHHNSRPPEYEEITHNSYGFRTHEFPTRKQPQDYFVLCFGESTTYGTTRSNEVTWPAQLETKLAAAFPNRHITVFNLGVDMSTTAVSIVNLALVGVHLHPDLVIAYHGNDMRAIGTANFRPDYSHYFRDYDPQRVLTGMEVALPSWMYRSYVVSYFTASVDIIGRLNDLGQVALKPHIPDPDPMRGIEVVLRNFASLHGLAASAGARSLFATYHAADPNMQIVRDYNTHLRDYFVSKDLPFVDMERTIPKNDPSINIDLVHFTEKGDGIMADNFMRAIVDRNWIPADPPQGGTDILLPFTPPEPQP